MEDRSPLEGVRDAYIAGVKDLTFEPITERDFRSGETKQGERFQVMEMASQHAARVHIAFTPKDGKRFEGVSIIFWNSPKATPYTLRILTTPHFGELSLRSEFDRETGTLYVHCADQDGEWATSCILGQVIEEEYMSQNPLPIPTV